MDIPNIREQNRKATYHLLHIDEERKKYQREMNGLSFIRSPMLTGMPHGTDVSNPTMNNAEKIFSLEDDYRWIPVISAVEESITEKQSKFLELRRKAEKIPHTQGRPNWTSYVQTEYSMWHQSKYGNMRIPSRITLNEWMNGIIELTVRVAISNHCL